MSAPVSDIVQIEYRNPHASIPLIVPVAVICNTSDEQLERNIRENSSRDLPWVAAKTPHDGIAVMCGGGASIADHLDDIRGLQEQGATVFAMNGASSYLRGNAIHADAQVVADAKAETASLVDQEAKSHLFASQVHPLTAASVKRPSLWHLEIGNIERLLPSIRRRKGGYALIGGGASVGNSALCLAYAMGYRTFHVFGYDSCHKEGRSHAYPQPMNDFIPTVKVEWAARSYVASVAMKAQAEKFQITAQALKQAGCEIAIYGEGLLQAMFCTPATDLNERDKYRLLWQFSGYREYSPGEEIVPLFLDIVKPEGLIIDFGCGTGRASLSLADRGHEVMLVDFADNCRDEEAMRLPFLEWDLSRPCPLRSNYGLCTDVMEHIPENGVQTVLENILNSARNVFFQISTRPDDFGAVVGATLHHTVKPHQWWFAQFEALGFQIPWQKESPSASCFLVSRPAN